MIFNSGYDANLGLLSSVPGRKDLILYDELSHASIYDGIRLSYATAYKFKHNDLSNLTDLLTRNEDKHENIYIVVESVYSMDGDFSPLREIIKIKNKFNNCFLIIDEAHGLGVVGERGLGLCDELGITEDCFARIYTYGKAMGCHGSSVVGDNILREYLINHSRSFIYSTALPEHSICLIESAYRLLAKTEEIKKLRENIVYLKSISENIKNINSTNSAIQNLILGDNKLVDETESRLSKVGIFSKSIKSPTVKLGSERLRICIHSFNTKEEIDLLIKNL